MNFQNNFANPLSQNSGYAPDNRQFDQVRTAKALHKLGSILDLEQIHISLTL